ncbi:hypothetical protein [Atrimonas thermophila]|uniref:hypothetical protein n=1 Tax=Atrimonas thermophila TaxID=3064161 RepID=UPI00399C7756
MVTYRTQIKSPIRYKTSLPSRFLIALVAGISITLPKGRFEAMEKFILSHQIGFAYEGSQEVFRVLQEQFFRLVQNTETQKSFVFNSEELRLFVEKVIK